MKPEEICVSLEIAQKLKEAGWNKRAVFIIRHYLDNNDHYLLLTDSREPRKITNEVGDTYEFIYSPTFQEIWEELPLYINGMGRIEVNKNHIAIVDIENLTTVLRVSFPIRTRLQDTTAEVWLWCKKEGCIS